MAGFSWGAAFFRTVVRLVGAGLAFALVAAVRAGADFAGVCFVCLGGGALTGAAAARALARGVFLAGFFSGLFGVAAAGVLAAGVFLGFGIDECDLRERGGLI